MCRSEMECEICEREQKERERERAREDETWKKRKVRRCRVTDVLKR